MPPLPPPGDPDAVEAALAARGPERSALRRDIDAATATPVHISYVLGQEWFEGVRWGIDVVETLVDSDPPAALLLAERMMLNLARADLDDSNGYLADAFGRLEPLHASACDAIGLTGVALADRLRALVDASELLAFDDVAVTHAQVLGQDGLRAMGVESR